MKNDLVNVKQKNADVIIDLRYASKIILLVKNFLIQMNVTFTTLHLNIFVNLSKFPKLGYKLKIFDAYRPVYVQKH